MRTRAQALSTHGIPVATLEPASLRVSDCRQCIAVAPPGHGARWSWRHLARWPWPLRLLRPAWHASFVADGTLGPLRPGAIARFGPCLPRPDRQPRRELHFARDNGGSQSRYLAVAGHE